MSLKSVIDNYKSNGLKYFTPKRAFVYLRSLFRKITGYKIKERNAIAFSEIVTYKTLKCPDCVQLGHCRVCKCPINELFTSMDVGCSDGKFPAFQEKRDWDIIKYELKKGNFKEAFKEFKKSKHWSVVWNEYKKKEKLFFTIFYG